MNKRDLNKFFSQEPVILYPLKAFEECRNMETDSNFAITCNINNFHIPSLMIKCDQNSLKNFGIDFPPPQPALQFRMLDIYKKYFVIEIVLHFDNSTKMRLHLDPTNKLVYHFMSQLKATTLISFHFYSHDNNTFISTMTTIDDEQIEWVDRNLKLASNLSATNKSGMITDFLIEQSNTPNDKIYKFKNVTNRKYLTEFATKFIGMQNDKYIKI